MSTLPALMASLVVVGAGVAWVRPVGCLPRSRPRELPVLSGTEASVGGWCPGWFAAMVRPAALPVPADRAWTLAVGAVSVVFIGGLVIGGPGLAVVAFIAGATAGWFGLRAARHRLDAQVARGVPDTLDSVARSTRSGMSVVQALAALHSPGASPADRVFVAVAAQVARGRSLHEALAELADTTSVPAVHLAVTALVVGGHTGAAPARAVEGVAATLRDRLALDRELAAQSSQARASVSVLVLAPLAFGLFAMATDPRVGQFLFRSPVGWVCLVMGLGLNGAGALWMRRIMGDVR